VDCGIAGSRPQRWPSGGETWTENVVYHTRKNLEGGGYEIVVCMCLDDIMLSMMALYNRKVDEVEGRRQPQILLQTSGMPNFFCSS
jgi:hypothetical protein